MGWASGSSVLRSVWKEVREHIPDDKKQAVLVNLMNVFSKRDCDTLDEVVCDEWPESGPAYYVWSGDEEESDG